MTMLNYVKLYFVNFVRQTIWTVKTMMCDQIPMELVDGAGSISAYTVVTEVSCT